MIAREVSGFHITYTQRQRSRSRLEQRADPSQLFGQREREPDIALHPH